MSDSLVTIATYPNPVEAEIACEFLRSEGFAAEVANQAMQTAVLGAGNPLVRIELKVPPDESVEALRCLTEQQAAVGLPAAQPEADVAPIPEPTPARTDGMYRTDWNDRERLVERAYRCSVLGPFIPFLPWYALLCTVNALTRTEPLRQYHRRRLVIATVVSGLFSLIWTFFVLLLVLPIRR